MSDWLSAYRTSKDSIWIKCTLSNGANLFFHKIQDWKNLKARCENEQLSIKKMSLQFKSHEVEVDIKGCRGVYLIRASEGNFSGNTKQYLVTGKIKGKKVHKQFWLVPELIVDKVLIDDIDSCFPETMIYHAKKPKAKKL